MQDKNLGKYLGKSFWNYLVDKHTKEVFQQCFKGRVLKSSLTYLIFFSENYLDFLYWMNA